MGGVVRNTAALPFVQDADAKPRGIGKEGKVKREVESLQQEPLPLVPAKPSSCMVLGRNKALINESHA